MRIFRNQWITKFAKKHKISDSELIEAVERADNGLIDADLGGGVIKQRIARQGQGRSGGYRSLIFFRHGERAFFMTAFAMYLNIGKNQVSEWERGIKKPSGAALKLLTIVKNKGIKAIA